LLRSYSLSCQVTEPLGLCAPRFRLTCRHVANRPRRSQPVAAPAARRRAAARFVTARARVQRAVHVQHRARFKRPRPAFALGLWPRRHRDPSGAGATILIRRAKSDVFGNGRLGYVSEQTCELIQSWLTTARIDEGWIFRRIRANKPGAEALNPYTVNCILKSQAEAAKLSPDAIKALSGHSMRVGRPGYDHVWTKHFAHPAGRRLENNACRRPIC
jgi:hypothetical protein